MQARSQLANLEAQWASELSDWAIPDEFLAKSNDSPFQLHPETFKPDPKRRDTPSMQMAAEALLGLPESERSLLDVGCAAGGTSLILLPPAISLIAWDQSEIMLGALRENAKELEIAPEAITTVNSSWPPSTSVSASVVTCANVLYNVATPFSFISALIDAATYHVVIELTARHPHFSVNPIWEHFHSYRRPIQPSYHEIIKMVELMGYQPKVNTWERNQLEADDSAVIGSIAQRACLAPAQFDDLANYLNQYPLAPTTVVAISFSTSR